MTAYGTVAKIRRLMPADPSRSINPLRLATAGESIEGSLRLDSMERLKGLLLDYDGDLKYSLSFAFDESGLCVVDSKISASVMMECQRCLQPFVIDIQKTNLLGIVKNKDEMESLAATYEPLLLEEDVMPVDELIEDELILAIPLSPLHPVEMCSGQKELDRINADAKPNPFAVLASLKRDKE